MKLIESQLTKLAFQSIHSISFIITAVFPADVLKYIYFATNQVWDEIAKDSTHQTTTAWKVWISHDLTQNNAPAFFCHDKFSVLQFSNLFYVAKTLGMTQFCFCTSQYKLSKKLLKLTASGITCHYITMLIEGLRAKRAYIEFWPIFIFCSIELIFARLTCFDMKSIVP